jgi:hypothetical protein
VEQPAIKRVAAATDAMSTALIDIWGRSPDLEPVVCTVLAIDISIMVTAIYLGRKTF